MTPRTDAPDAWLDPAPATAEALAAHGLEVRSQIVCHAFCIHSAHGIRHRPGPPGYRAVPLLRRTAAAHSPSVSSPRR